MYKLKKYVIALCVMVVTTVLALLTLGMLVFCLKWQADKAMVGIIGIYILAAVSGGITLNRLGKREYRRRKIIETLVLGSLYSLLLIIVAVLGCKIPFRITSRFILIWLLFVCGTFCGIHIKM